MPQEKLTQFDYLLNAMESAGREKTPADQGYGDKRKALYTYVRGLEAHAAAPEVAPAEPVLRQAAVNQPGASWRTVDPTAAEPTIEARIAYLRTVTRGDGTPAYKFRDLYAAPPAQKVGAAQEAAEDHPQVSEAWNFVREQARLLADGKSISGLLEAVEAFGAAITSPPCLAHPAPRQEPAAPSGYERMFSAAVASIAEISAALGIDAEEAETANGNDLILQRVGELLALEREAHAAAEDALFHEEAPYPAAPQDGSKAPAADSDTQLQVRQADARGDEAMRRAHAAEKALASIVTAAKYSPYKTGGIWDSALYSLITSIGERLQSDGLVEAPSRLALAAAPVQQAPEGAA